MKKKVIAVMVASSLLVGSAAVVFSEETDYSYLEDMSVKELRALDAAIHELLGDSGEVCEENEEQINLTQEEKFVVACVAALKDYLVDPSSLQINHAYFGHENIELGSGDKFNNVDTAIFDFTAASGSSSVRKFATVNLRIEKNDRFVYGTIEDIDDYDMDVETWSSSPNGLIDYEELELDKILSCLK